MKSWKTSLGGAMAAVGGMLAGAGVLTQFSGAPEYAKELCWWLVLLGFLLTSFGAGFGLLFARDNNVTSEEVQAAKAAKEEKKAINDWLGGKGTLWLLTALLAFGTVACIRPNRIAPGADPLVVQAEQFSKESIKNLDAFIKWVDRNPVLGSDLKSARELAATSGPVYINQLDAAIRTYKGSRTPDNANAVQAHIDALQGLIELIREHYTPKSQ
jgi:hypothetical protein